jgi:branched-chain amino acid transport system permease protein
MSGRPSPHTRSLAVGLAALAGVLLFASVPLWMNGFYTGVATRVVVFSLFGLAFNVVFGAGGMPSLGHAAFFGLGGYLLGIGVTRWDLGFWVVLGLALLLGAVVGMAVGVLTLRTHGVYLLLLTLAVGQAFWGLAFQQVALTGGDNGIAGLPRSDLVPGGGNVVTFYWFVLSLAVVVAALLWWFQRSPAGVAIVAHRESASRLAALGYRVGAYRVAAFGVSGAAAAVAGVLYALHNRFVGPENLAWQMSAEVMLFAIVGGATYFAGPIVGAVFLVALETWASGFTERWVSILGLTYILSMLYLPRGVLGLLDDLVQRVRRRRDDGAPDESVVGVSQVRTNKGVVG